MRSVRIFMSALFAVLLAAGTCYSEAPAARFSLDVKEFTLKNGMLFLVVERHTTPQVACRLSIRAGSALEETGKTGIAHLLEHMMFKGTKNFGTLDVEKDRELQRRIDEAYQSVRREQTSRAPDKKLIEKKLAEMERLRLEVQKIYVPQSFSMQLERNGAVNINAYTSTDQTQYMASVPSDMIEQWVSIVSEQLFEPSWREFYVEKEVVQREWAFRYVNDVEGAAWLDLYSTAYRAHPYRNPIIGWKSDMETYTTADAVAFHKKYYTPSNAVCVLVGDITVERAKRLAEIYFERYPAGERAPEQVTKEPPQEGTQRSVRFLGGARKPLVRVGFHGAGMGTRDFYALDAINMILSSGRSARMTRNIEEKGLALDVWSYNPDNRYGGLFILGGSPKEPESLKDNDTGGKGVREAYLKACEDLEKILLSEVEKLKAEPVSERELERVRKINQSSFIRGLKSNEGLAGRLASLEVQTGWRYFNTYLEEMNRVTPEEIRDAARKYLVSDNMAVVYVIPGGEAKGPVDVYREIRSGLGSSIFKGSETDLQANHSEYPTPEGWKHPLSFTRTPEKIDYPEAQAFSIDGTKVFYLPDRELPLVDLALLFKAGDVDVDERMTGLGGLLEKNILRGGTENYSPHELALFLDENAVKLSVSVESEHTLVKVSFMREDWEKGISILKEVLTRPRFDREIFNVVKEEKISDLKRQGGDADAVLRRELNTWHFKGHPYGRDPLIALETLPAIRVGDLRNFLEKYLVPSNMVVAVSGDVELEKVKSGLEGLLAAFPEGKAPERRLEDPGESPPVLAFIHKPGQVQSHVGITLEGVKRSHPDYWKLTLLADILGGSDSLMYKRLRDDLGLAYAAYFYQTYMWQAGILKGYMGVRGSKTARAIEETVKLMSGLSKEIPEGMLEQKRLDVLNSFVFNVDSPDDLVRTYATYYMRKEPLDTLEKIQDAYISVGKDELESLAKRYLVPGKLQIFIVGDKNTSVRGSDGTEISLETDIKELARRLGLPYREIPLR